MNKIATTTDEIRKQVAENRVVENVKPTPIPERTPTTTDEARAYAAAVAANQPKEPAKPVVKSDKPITSTDEARARAREINGL